MKKTTEVRRYSSFADDFVRTKDQYHRLPEDYRWIRTDVRSRFLSALSYGAALVISSVWCRVALHVRLRDRRLLRAARDGAFIYANHTQPVGDVFIPALASFPRRIYTVVSPANLGIPVIGRILPFLGAADSGHPGRDARIHRSRKNTRRRGLQCRYLSRGACLGILHRNTPHAGKRIHLSAKMRKAVLRYDGDIQKTAHRQKARGGGAY